MQMCELIKRKLNMTENAVVSPLGFWFTAAMMQLGASEDGAKRISELTEQTTEELKEHTFVDGANMGPAVVFANGFAVNSSVSSKVNTEYCETIKTYMGAETLMNATPDMVNQWLKERSAGKLDRASFEEDTEAEWLSILVFNDTWDLFDKQNTYDGDFNLLDGTVKQVPMMHADIQNVLVNEAESFIAVRLKMRYSELWIYLPKDGYTVEDVQNNLMFGDEEELTARTVDVSMVMPRFKIENKVDCTSDFKELAGDEKFYGVTSAGLGIGQASQQVSIEVNESGVQGKAVTEAKVYFGSVCIPDTDEQLQFIVDRPFVFLASYQNTEVFTGVVVEP